MTEEQAAYQPSSVAISAEEMSLMRAAILARAGRNCITDAIARIPSGYGDLAASLRSIGQLLDVAAAQLAAAADDCP